MFNRENGNIVVTGGNSLPGGTTLQFLFQKFGNKYVENATHDVVDPARCHPGTRTSFLARLVTWVEDVETSVCLTWMHGPAGAGKSAIARTLADRLYSDSLLAGSFFFFGTDSRRNTVEPLFTTLAYQIACNIPETQPHIANAIEADPSIYSRSLETQLKTLILEPLEYVKASNPDSFLQTKLIIIDGLDECVGQSARNLVLQNIFNALPRFYGLLKLLIVSRPEYDLKRSFDSAVARRAQDINILKLQGDLQADEDIRNYLRDNFSRIKQTHSRRGHSPPNWPSDDTIELVVEKSFGGFMCASTVVKYIENDQQQNHLTCSTPQSPFAALEALHHQVLTYPGIDHPLLLDALYLHILTSSAANHTLLVDILSIAILDGRFDHILPLDKTIMKSTCFIESILFLQPGEVEKSLLDLKSLVGADGIIEFWHRSFSEFLLDPSRSNQFYACPVRACTLIAKGCLWLLSDKTGLLERLWSGFTHKSPTLVCHQLLSLRCQNAILDPDLQSAMMEYEFNVIPPCPDTCKEYFWVLCSCLCIYQRASIFKRTTIVEHLRHQFDKYFISELRRWVPLDSEIMDILRNTISPLRINWKAYKEFASKIHWGSSGYESCFLYYMCYERGLEGEIILCEFFYSQDRAGEYFLGEVCPALVPPTLTNANGEIKQGNIDHDVLDHQGLSDADDTATSTTAFTATERTYCGSMVSASRLCPEMVDIPSRPQSPAKLPPHPSIPNTRTTFQTPFLNTNVDQSTPRPLLLPPSPLPGNDAIRCKWRSWGSFLPFIVPLLFGWIIGFLQSRS